MFKDGLADYGNSLDFDLTREPYEFDILRVIEHEGEYYLATDSGCSCPMPFENYAGLEDCTGPLTLEETLEEIETLVSTSRYFSIYPTQAELDRFLNEVREM